VDLTLKAKVFQLVLETKPRTNITVITVGLINYYSASAQLAMQSAVLDVVNPSVCRSVRLPVSLSVCHTLALCQNDSSYNHGSSLEDSPMTLVSSWLTSARNSNGNIGSEGAE